jgi:uncharacterized protein involved in type VI secretion and phage assembly
MTTQYFGIYRGTVVNNIDPMQMGRIMVIVPNVGGTTSSWAMPCVPLAGTQMGTFMVPPVGANVWMQFEGGDPNYPVWTGGYWSTAADVPPLGMAGLAGPPANPNIVLQSSLHNVVVISDVAGPTGGIMLMSATGARIVVNDTGIYIDNGKGASIAMVGPTVTINNGALEVT